MRTSWHARGNPTPLTITSTSRLAREFRQNDDREQIAAGFLTWISPGIFSFNAWLERCWNDCLYSDIAANRAQLLRPSQEKAIWEEIVAGSDEGQKLLQAAATADAAFDAWNLMCAWQLSLNAPEWNDSNDTEVFRSWAREFQRRCETENWLPGALLPEFVAGRIDDGALPAPECIVLAGFNEFAPAQELVLQSLRRRGCRIEKRERAGLAAQPKAVRIGLLDTEAEIRAAAQWSRRLVEKRPERPPRIGIVIPDLSKYRNRIERVFADEFHPGTRLTPELDSRRAFNISLGPALSEYPLIHAAFLILQACPSAIPLEQASSLLRSPFIGGAQTEYTRRAQLDAKLRELREPELPASGIVSPARSAPPLLVHAVTQWTREFNRMPSRQPPSDWAASFSRLLKAMGWPGERPLSSTEYQIAAAWKELLEEFASLDTATGSIPLGRALATLHRMAGSRQFQPESEPAPVQILGVFEASGMEFDGLWIMGMHDAAWPGAASPNPFLPHRLQRERNMPQSSPQRELEFTRLLTGQLLQNAESSIVVSYPRREGDSDYRPSPLFARLAEIGEDALISTAIAYPEQLRRSARMELIEDDTGPRWDGALRRGGSAIFTEHAACPFRSFARLRLGADALEFAEQGLSSLDRGILIHDVLERVWSELQCHHGLVSANETAIKDLVQKAVQESIAEMAGCKRVLRQARFAAIEQARLEKIVTEWLELERLRKPFQVLRQEEQRHVTAGGIDLTIRADRVDRLDDGSVVLVDYKSGEHSPSEWDGDRPDEPQLPLYAITSEETLSGVLFGIIKTGKNGFAGLTVTEAIVPKVKPRPNDIPFPERIEKWRAVLEALAADFRSGNAKVYPKNPQKTCNYCKLTGLCRIGEAARPDGADTEEAHG